MMTMTMMMIWKLQAAQDLYLFLSSDGVHHIIVS